MSAAHDSLRWRREIEANMAKQKTAEFQATIEAHGGLEGWYRHCKELRDADPDHKLARIVGRLIRSGGELNQWDRARLDADVELAGYFRSVADAGRSAWIEERRRIKAVQEKAAGEFQEAERMKMLDTLAIKSLLRVWRVWGRVILSI